MGVQRAFNFGVYLIALLSQLIVLGLENFQILFSVLSVLLSDETE